MVLKGGSARKNKGQSYTLAAQFVKFTEFCGRAYSWGDDFIESRAAKKGGPGNASNWRAVGFSHHMAKVTAQIASLP
jgi:hypothetical protein